MFNPKLATCTFVFPESVGNLLSIILTTHIPFIGITSTNIALWFYTQTLKNRIPRLSVEQRHKRLPVRQNYKRRMSRRRNKSKALITTSSITTLFVLSWIPTVIRFTMSSIIGEKNIPNWIEKLRYLYFLGAYGNPVIYTLINKSFRVFVISKFKKSISKLSDIFSRNT